MTPHLPTTGPAPLKVGLGRGNVVVTVALLVFLGAVVWFSARGAWSMPNLASQVLTGAIAVAFAIPLVMLLRALPRFLSPRYVIVDQAGLSIQHGKEQIMLPWQELRAVGIGYEVANAEPVQMPYSVDQVTDQVKGYLAGRAQEALQVSDRRRLVLEIFPVRPDAGERVPRLKPYWKTLPPPTAGLAEWGWRFPLPPVVSIAQEIANGLAQRAPYHWLGWFGRPWSAKK